MGSERVPGKGRIRASTGKGRIQASARKIEIRASTRNVGSERVPEKGPGEYRERVESGRVLEK